MVTHIRIKAKKIFILSIYIILLNNPYIVSGQNNNSDLQGKLKFSLNYQSLRPVDIHKAVFYFSKLKNSAKKDSLVTDFVSPDALLDTIFIQPKWNFPMYIKLKLECTDLNRFSNEFYYYPGIKYWNVMVYDSTLKVKSKKNQSFSNPYKPVIGLILVIQTAIEMIMALMMSQLIGWSRTVWVMVLTANIASFPIYVVNFSHIWLREILVLITKTFVMSIIGYRKIHIYKIILFAVILSFVSFGLKEILFIVMRII